MPRRCSAMQARNRERTQIRAANYKAADASNLKPPAGKSRFPRFAQQQNANWRLKKTERSVSVLAEFSKLPCMRAYQRMMLPLTSLVLLPRPCMSRGRAYYVYMCFILNTDTILQNVLDFCMFNLFVHILDS